MRLRNVGIGHLGGGINDAEVHALLNGMIQEHGVHRLANIVVAPEREAEVAHPAAYMSTSKMLTYPTCRPYEVSCITVVLLHTSRHSQHIGVEDDVVRVDADLADQQAIGPLSYLDTSLVVGGLTLLVETHHHDGSAVSFHVAGMIEKPSLALLQGYGIDDALALHTLQSVLDDLPVGGVDHHRHPGDIRLCSDAVEEVHHLGLGVEQSIVHIDINHEGAVGHLFAGDADGLVVILLFDEAEELS